ncbi:MAG: FtsJ-like methyltransferase family protein, partial [Patescibacteria group bacterium]
DIKIRLKSNIVFIKRDVFGLLESGLGELKEKYQVVISDLAPSTSGIKAVDSEKSFELCQEALKIAQKVLLANGNFVCKIFEGKSTKVFIEELEKKLYFVKRFKPKAVSKKSKEFYIIGKNLRIT